MMSKQRMIDWLAQDKLLTEEIITQAQNSSWRRYVLCM